MDQSTGIIICNDNGVVVLLDKGDYSEMINRVDMFKKLAPETEIRIELIDNGIEPLLDNPIALHNKFKCKFESQDNI